VRPHRLQTILKRFDRTKSLSISLQNEGDDLHGTETVSREQRRSLGRETKMNDPEHSAMEWLQMIRGEYLEIPGLQLTRLQVRRLWGLDERICSAILDTLIAEQFLRLTSNGRYIRADSELAPSSRRAVVVDYS
jgi:hypothetical protein